MPKYPKKPKKPRSSASLKTWENYEKRFKAWETKVKGIDAAVKKKEQIKNKYS